MMLTIWLETELDCCWWRNLSYLCWDLQGSALTEKTGQAVGRASSSNIQQAANLPVTVQSTQCVPLQTNIYLHYIIIFKNKKHGTSEHQNYHTGTKRDSIPENSLFNTGTKRQSPSWTVMSVPLLVVLKVVVLLLVRHCGSSVVTMVGGTVGI